MNNTAHAAITKDENDALVYDYAEIDRSAYKHGITPETLRDFAFENVTEEMTSQELVSVYFEWVDAEKEAVQESIYPLQLEWAQGQADFNEPTNERTDEIIARYIKTINHPGPVLRDAVFAAMDEWKSEVEASE